jgi:hypothetical protein
MDVLFAAANCTGRLRFSGTMHGHKWHTHAQPEIYRRRMRTAYGEVPGTKINLVYVGEYRPKYAQCKEPGTPRIIAFVDICHFLGYYVRTPRAPQYRHSAQCNLQGLCNLKDSRGLRGQHMAQVIDI